MKVLLPAAAFAASLFTASAALAAPAQVTTTLNLRTGPGVGYRVETAMPAGAVVDVAGCTSGYGWCRVRWNGYDGWASSSYLASRQARYRHRRFNHYGAQIGIPLIAGAVISGVFGSHHDRDHGHYDHDRNDHDRDHGHHRSSGRHRGGDHDRNGHRYWPRHDKD